MRTQQITGCDPMQSGRERNCCVFKDTDNIFHFLIRYEKCKVEKVQLCTKAEKVSPKQEVVK